MSQEVQKLEGKEVSNPYKSAEVVKSGNENSSIAAESQKAMIEVMTQFEMAKRFPRDMELCADKILRECSRPTLAEISTYSYSRGGTPIEGPTIRLMEAIARAWGNIRFGWKVLDTNAHRSLIRAFAIDIETNIDRSTEFSVKHWRDTKSGGYALKDERDIFELCSNQAMRRVRGCLEGLIPRDVIDMALEKCEATNIATVDMSPAAIEKLKNDFAVFSVNEAMIKAKFQGGGMTKERIVQLRKILASMIDGIGKPEDFFDLSLADKKTESNTQPDLKKEVDKKKADEEAKKEAVKDQKKPEASNTPDVKKDAPPHHTGKLV